MLALLNPEPETVSVNAAEPAVRFEGLIELIAGTGVVVVGVAPLPEEGVPLEHPVKKTKKIRLQATTDRRNEADTKRDDAEKGTGDRLSFYYF